MNKNIRNLARFGLAVGIVRLINRRREGRMKRLFRRLGRRQSLTARRARQLAMFTRRSSRGLGSQVRTLPLAMNRFGRRAPARRALKNLPLIASLSLPALSALSVQNLVPRNLPWMSSRRESLMARQDGRMTALGASNALGTRMAGVTAMARSHRWLTVLGLGAVLGLGGLFVFGRLVRTRSSAPALPAWPDENQYPRYRPAGASPAAQMPMMGRSKPAVGQPDWARFCREFSQANRDRPVNVEVQEAGGSLRALAHAVPLLGVDLGAEGAQIMLGENMENRMEHDIPDLSGLQPIVDQNGVQVGLVMRGGDGSTTTLKLA